MKLVICEKPSQAQAYAAVLNAKKRQDGFLEGDLWIVSWCFGHLVELAAADSYGDQYKRWSRDTLPILPERWKYEVTKDKAKQLSVLRGLMNRADVESIVCATDAGREGELIFRLVYDQCKCKKPVQRLWISSMEDSAVREGFAKLRPGAEYDNLYRSALCRSQADWLVGINATRLFSCLYGSTLSVGRVQSPTLAMIVAREEAVRGFMPEPFYTPEIDCGAFTASGEKVKDAAAAEAVCAAADGHDAAVLSVEKAKKTAAPPKLYDLTTLQREANRLFGFTAQQTLDYTQSLYEKKLCSYPRTDSRYLSGDMRETAGKIVAWIQKDMEYKDGADFTPDIGRLINDKAVTDHHAVIPTVEITKTNLSALPSGECDILNLIACRLLCAAAPVHSYEATTAVLECGGHKFTAKGKIIIAEGWKAADTAFKASLKNKPEAEEDDTALPELAEGQVFQSVTASVKEGKTSPPHRYTEDTLLSAMETAGAEDMPEDAERKGLGTPATRAATIEKLIKSSFVQRELS
jgi:DNA topoisomerase-3